MTKPARQLGIWIDRRHALLVTLGADGTTATRIESEVEPHFRLSGGSRSASPFAPQDVAADGKADARRRKQLRDYYRRVIEQLRDADTLYIFGPGEARAELEKELRKAKGLRVEIAAIEPADRMTDRQVAAAVRRFYAAHTARA